MENFFNNELVDKFEQMVEDHEKLYFDSDEMEQIVIHYLEMGDISYAELAVEYAMELHPGSYDIKVKYLEVLLEMNRNLEAKKLIEELKDYASESSDFLVCCAKFYSNLGNSQKAIEYCKKALENSDEENFLYDFIADEYINMDDPLSALKYYKKALLEDDEDEYALGNIMNCFNRLGKAEDSIAFLKNYLKNHPFSEIAWLEYGKFYMSRKNYEEALNGFDYILAINPDSISVNSYKAACYEGLKEWDNAIAVYKAMIQKDSFNASTHYKIGICYREKKEFEKALRAFQKALVEDPQFYLAMIEKSCVYEEMGMMKEALYFTEQAVSMDPDNLYFKKRLALLYALNFDYEESIPLLEDIVSREPNQFYNWYAYAEILVILSQYQKAKEVLTKAIEMFNRSELYYLLGDVHILTDENPKAQQLFRKAALLDEKNEKDKLSGFSSIAPKDFDKEGN
ncbi:tetratricopeptide repeat protein [Riemerella columbipharyngis]|uniref:Tetratricopeptide repeat-containing protein n=1 Tax=Riemerella columbipharyngis TaxID=1071918 RepID=A0A1G7ENU4_9FLAO|nr:tetratricopeptide repeat protein [Riemerella columbipharyngis]SDE65136.1 Tetratricopeptide repeat-containing protein [Riemerella columbipharyngis]